MRFFGKIYNAERLARSPPPSENARRLRMQYANCELLLVSFRDLARKNESRPLIINQIGSRSLPGISGEVRNLRTPFILSPHTIRGRNKNPQPARGC